MLTPAGSVSVTVISDAEFVVLRFVTVIVYVSIPLATTGSREAVLVIERSTFVDGGVLTVVDAVAVLLELLLSDVALLTVIVLLIVPAVFALTSMLMVTLDPLARVPRLHVNVVVPLQLPTLGVAETKVTVSGNVSETVTLLAVPGPLFVTVIE